MVPLLQRVTFVKAGMPGSVVDGAIPDQKQGRGGLRADRVLKPTAFQMWEGRCDDSTCSRLQWFSYNSVG